MKKSRNKSNDPITLTNWRWSIFINDALNALSTFKHQPYPISPEFLYKENSIDYKKTRINAKAMLWACKTEKIRQARAACIDAGKAASVLNLVINPQHDFELPFFGADFVTLPSGHLLALDLQPVLHKDDLHNNYVFSRLIPIYQRWKSFFPSGGPIPEEAKPFFSKGFLWSRLPLSIESDKIIVNELRQAFNEYLELYIDLLKNSHPVSTERSSKLLSGQKAYVNYRRAKDPARGMLSRFYGKEWTEAFINTALFPL
ncbi:MULTISPECIES: phycoerythrobilin:ferredoxin oxidoreductase [Prochlorococcus]|uniref:phycoerythrobilin:ferredoxin oxidoreductase n=1 Tax=Prochlorococcus TaxID=1218 RepID=UPI000533B1E5|nr:MULTISPECIES: phycoerythrobilin:ferredoxin oxidoreductase [Prochlorococcus]KGG13617.1 Phycoerythrobilin:ferredoxin oxidoreductase PebB [Prochlorococcus sp. MIT 0601]